MEARFFRSTRNEYRTDHHVGIEAGALDFVGVGGDGLHMPLVDGIHLTQTWDVEIEEQNLGLHSQCNGSSVLT